MEKGQINNVFRLLQEGIHWEKNSSLDFCKIGKFGNGHHIFQIASRFTA
jgi:hypothetical protein